MPIADKKQLFFNYKLICFSLRDDNIRTPQILEIQTET